MKRNAIQRDTLGVFGFLDFDTVGVQRTHFMPVSYTHLDVYKRQRVGHGHVGEHQVVPTGWFGRIAVELSLIHI